VYFGHHLVDHLLKRTGTELIYCLAVRNLEVRLRNKEILTDSRVQYRSGDLSDCFLGLSEEEADSIFAQANAVIHSGADNSHT
jgi:thioester reductase-like protein